MKTTEKIMSDHTHSHDAHAPITDSHDGSYYEKKLLAIQALLIEKGIVTGEAMRQTVEAMEARAPAQGARVVARAWVDPAFKQRVLTDAKAAIAELGVDIGTVATLVAVENTETVHNVVVCTLCSCYPRMLLGLPPDWYKSLHYRSRVVKDPRGVLKEFGLELPAEVSVQVYDSTADIRYLVIPNRPPGTEHLSEDALAQLVTRDSMIGVTTVHPPDMS
jgi:nitrile hydratase